MSRPKLSVPNGCSGLGGCKGMPNPSGEYGMTKGPTIATRVMTSKSAAPVTSVPLTRLPLFLAPRGVTDSVVAGATTAVVPLVIRHPRVEEGVSHVRQKVDRNDEDRHHQGDGLDDRIVSGLNRGNHQESEPRNCEDRFDDDCAADQEAQVDAEDSHGRDQRRA